MTAFSRMACIFCAMILPAYFCPAMATPLVQDKDDMYVGLYLRVGFGGTPAEGTDRPMRFGFVAGPRVSRWRSVTGRSGFAGIPSWRQKSVPLPLFEIDVPRQKVSVAGLALLGRDLNGQYRALPDVAHAAEDEDETSLGKVVLVGLGVAAGVALLVTTTVCVEDELEEDRETDLVRCPV